MIKELVKKNRSYRRFYQEKKLTRQQLMELVETARLTPSAANRQPFKYRIVCDEEENEKVFRLLGFAGYLKDWDGPSEGQYLPAPASRFQRLWGRYHRHVEADKAPRPPGRGELPL